MIIFGISETQSYCTSVSIPLQFIQAFASDTIIHERDLVHSATLMYVGLAQCSVRNENVRSVAYFKPAVSLGPRLRSGMWRPQRSGAPMTRIPTPCPFSFTLPIVTAAGRLSAPSISLLTPLLKLNSALWKDKMWLTDGQSTSPGCHVEVLWVRLTEYAWDRDWCGVDNVWRAVYDLGCHAVL